MEPQAKKLITHDGSFHTDDVFACATLMMMLEGKGEKYEIIRTRDEKIIKGGDFVFDVGGVHVPEENRFDHHQIGGAGRHDNGIEYASFGLVWKKFGLDVAGSMEVVKIIEQNVVSPIDAFDNGMDLVENKNTVTPYYIQHIIAGMRPTWKEETEIDQIFFKAVAFAKEVLTRELTQARDSLEASSRMLSIYQNTKDKRILVLDENYSVEGMVYDYFPETLYIIYPRKHDGYWGVKTVHVGPKTFKNKRDLPLPWAGLHDEDLVNVTRVPDAVFCHRARFLAIAKSKEGAIKLAQIALES